MKNETYKNIYLFAGTGAYLGFALRFFVEEEYVLFLSFVVIAVVRCLYIQHYSNKKTQTQKDSV